MAKLEGDVRDLQKTGGERRGDTLHLTRIAARHQSHIQIQIQILVPRLQTQILLVLAHLTPVPPVMKDAGRGRDPLKALNECKKRVGGAEKEVDVMGKLKKGLNGVYIISSLFSCFFLYRLPHCQPFVSIYRSSKSSSASDSETSSGSTSEEKKSRHRDSSSKMR